MRLLRRTQPLLRYYSTIRDDSKFKLVKFDEQSKDDYLLFRKLIIDNMKFSALQFLIPNLKEEVDVNNSKALEEYFESPEKDRYISDAYKFVTNNHNKSNLGYCKVLNKDDQFIGNSGWILHDVDDKGIVHKLERGIHLDQSLCSSDSASGYSGPKIGARVMRDVVTQLEDNQDKLNPNGQLISSILESNKRSQAFTQKYKLNVGEPVGSEGGALKLIQKIGDFTKRIPEIKSLLDESISKQEVSQAR